MGVSKNNGPPQIIHSNRGFHYFHHPFWVPLFLETSISDSSNIRCSPGSLPENPPGPWREDPWMTHEVGEFRPATKTAEGFVLVNQKHENPRDVPR